MTKKFKVRVIRKTGFKDKGKLYKPGDQLVSIEIARKIVKHKYGIALEKIPAIIETETLKSETPVKDVSESKPKKNKSNNC